MNVKSEWLSISSIKEYFFIALLFIFASIISTLAVNKSSLPFYCALTTGLMAGVMITRGVKSIVGFFLGAVFWQFISIFSTIPVLHLTPGYSILYILSECLTLLIFYKSLNTNNGAAFLIEKNNGLKRFFTFALLSSLPQAIILSFILYNSSAINSTITYIKLLHLTWLSITLSILSLTPFFISFLNKNKKITLKNLQFSWEFLLFLIVLIGPSILEVLKVINPPYSFPIYFLVFPSIFIVAFRKNISDLTLSLLIFYLFTIYNASKNSGIFFSPDPYLNASNIHYFILFFFFISLVLGVVVNEKRLAFESLKKTYHGIEEEIQLQTNSFRELNLKLFQEIDHRGIIEKELTESRNLLEESQEIANITSWELNTETEEIKWSKSGYRVIGYNPSSPPSTLSEYKKYIFSDDLNSFNLLFNKLKNTPLNFEIELRHNMPNGLINYVLVHGRSFEEKGEICKVIGLSLDITKRKEAENQSHEREQKYKALFESNIDAVSVINPDNKTFIDVNKAFENRYGYTRDEIIGQPYSLITAEVEDTYSAIENAFRKGSHRVQTRIHKNKKGEEFFAEGIFVKFFASNKPLIFIISQDITKRKIAERSLAERELQYRLFFESDLIGMAEINQKKEWKSFNNKLCIILGYSAEELKQKTWDEITHPDDFLTELKLYNDVIVHKTDGYSIEKRFIRKDNSTIFCKVAVKAIFNPQGNITHFIKLIEDISSRKQIEKELLENRATLRRAQQIANLGSLSWKLAYNYITLNEVAYPLLGWKKTQGPFNIKNFMELISNEKRAFIEKTIEDSKKGIKHDESIEVPILINSGENRYLLLNVGFNADNSIEVSEIVITIADITDVKKAEVAFQEANSLKDQLFSIIAHDLRGPIGSLNQMITFIAENNDSLDNHSRNDLILSLKDSTQETYNLLENLLEWAKSQRQISFKPEVIHLKPIADYSLVLLSGMSSLKKITIKNDIEDELSAYADSYMIQTIFRNLISNAIKFTPNEGKIQILGFRDGANAVLKFIDSGMGIPKDIIGRLLDGSQNFTTLGTNNEQGTGLGLKLVKRLIEKNGGKILIESKPDKGSTFTIFLPLTQHA
ncbi:MAG: PAS domain S-box protein [Bacteroidales bacterium]|nr:PAS domain S-box protein [Bacteroidales bacterium]